MFLLTSMDEIPLSAAATPVASLTPPAPNSSSAEDRILVDRAQAGDTRAFDDLVRKYTPK
ncbi:MAG: polymerase subunit sigma-24, partial [Prosthecobacter sp.]|nr:polymerase subunit sigma-24 [Prosthecobacter sp.]